ncbi:hypothetical protein LCGC14_2720910, partial [marine sediment metagenome]
MTFRKWLPVVLLLVLAVLVVSLPTSSAAPAAGKSRHVLIIAIDGGMPSAIKKAKTPNLKALATGGTATWDGFAGGVLGTPSRQNTASLASYHSIFTGVWGNKHRGTRMRKGRPLPADHRNYPMIFQRIKKVTPKARCSSIVTWPRINWVMVPGADHKAQGKGDAGTTALVVKELAEQDPTVLFVQLDEVDGAGHKNNYGPNIPPY